MREKKIRHVPVVEDGNVLGIVGIRDVMGALVAQVWESRDEAAHETARGLAVALTCHCSWAHSSAGERPLHTREVPGSIPGAPISQNRRG